MSFVGFFVDGEVGESCGLVDAVKLAQAVDLRAGDFGNLPFVGVKRGHGFGYGAIAADFAEGSDYVLRARQGGAAGDVVLAKPDRGSEIAPELWMRGTGIFFFGEIFQHGVAERAFGAGG